MRHEYEELLRASARVERVRRERQRTRDVDEKRWHLQGYEVEMAEVLIPAFLKALAQAVVRRRPDGLPLESVEGLAVDLIKRLRKAGAIVEGEATTKPKRRVGRGR